MSHDTFQADEKNHSSEIRHTVKNRFFAVYQLFVENRFPDVYQLLDKNQFLHRF